MKNSKKILNQPGSRKTSSGTAPSILSTSLELRPKDLNPVIDLVTSQSQRVLRSEKSQKTDKLQRKHELNSGVRGNNQKQSTLDVLDLRSPQVSQTVSSPILFASEISTTNNDTVCIVDATSASREERNKLPHNGNLENAGWPLPPQILGRPFETEEQLTAEAGELPRTALVRTVTTVDPALFGVKLMVDRDHTTNVVYSRGNILKTPLLQEQPETHALLQVSTDSTLGSKQQTTSQQLSLQTTHKKLEPTIHSTDHGRKTNNGRDNFPMESKSYSTTHKSLQDLYTRETELKIQENLMLKKTTATIVQQRKQQIELILI